MIRQKLVDYCDARPVGNFLIRLLATILSTIALVAAIVAVVQVRPLNTYVDSDEASFGSYWRIPILLAVIWNVFQLFCLCIRGRQFPRSAWLAFIEMCIFILLISATTTFLGVQRPHDEEVAFGFSAVEGWLGMFSGFCNLVLSLAACQAARHKDLEEQPGNMNDVELNGR